jgi:rare lipoprotein A (peptidoglycan hydrolase)
MPYINGKFYINPTFGRAVGSARGHVLAEDQSGPQEQAKAAHWVTIEGHHVLIHGTDGGRDRGPDQDTLAESNQTSPKRPTKKFSGEATYYNLPGKRTASGAQFDPDTMTAAMTAEKGRLGQAVTVEYTYKDKQGSTVTKEVSVIVNDRGPFDRNPNGKAKTPLQPAPGRVIDLTPAAFRKLVGTTKPGHVRVTVTVPND